mmetsp:Transcript_25672/g.84539  ORF Transcript_25672/g.84539 Transcript_25672/m.84539 type:complete len:252 (-) Transcript_25672:7-762(-)
MSINMKQTTGVIIRQLKAIKVRTRRSTKRMAMMMSWPLMPVFFKTCTILRCAACRREEVLSAASSSSSSSVACASSSVPISRPTCPSRAIDPDRSSSSASCSRMSCACSDTPWLTNASLSLLCASSKRARAPSGLVCAPAPPRPPIAPPPCGSTDPFIASTSVFVSRCHDRRAWISDAERLNLPGSCSAMSVARSSSFTCHRMLSASCRSASPLVARSPPAPRRSCARRNSSTLPMMSSFTRWYGSSAILP